MSEIQVLGGAARQQAREAGQAADGEFVEARLVRAIENDERAGRTATRDQRDRDQFAGDVAAALVLELVGGNRLAAVDATARQLVADDGQLLACERGVLLGAAPDRAGFAAREHRGRGGTAQSQADRAQNTFRTALGHRAQVARSHLS